MIKKYSEFILELYQPEQSDPPEIASDINRISDLDKTIKDFEKSKVDINNIYLTYKDEIDLINKLSARNFIEKKTSDKKQIKFLNPLLSLWAQSCQKRRDLSSIDASIKKDELEVKNQKDNLNANPSMKDSINANIKSYTDRINTKKQDILKLQKEIIDLEKTTRDNLKEIKDEFSLSKKRTDLYNSQKVSTSANTNNG